MSATSATPAVAPVVLPRPAILPRLISAFSGTTGLVVKIVLLSLMNAFAAWAIYVLMTRSHWVAVIVLVLSTLLLAFLTILFVEGWMVG